MDSVVKQLGERVRFFRQERDMSLEDLSEAIGLGVEQLKKIERGASPPSFASFLALAHTFRLDPIYLLTYPGLNPIHDLIEATRGTPKATVLAMQAACEGLAAGLGRARRTGGW